MLLPLLLASAHLAGSHDVFTPSPLAVQTIYRSGVPHTDRNGQRLMLFDPKRSFLPLVLYDAQLPGNTTPADTLKGQNTLPYGYDATIYATANYTGVLPYPAFSMGDYMDGYPTGDSRKSFSQAGLQVIRESPQLVTAPAHGIL